MLVRELMEQLAELPADVPVHALLRSEDRAEVTAAIKGGRETGVGVLLVLDKTDLYESYSDYLEDRLDWARE
jgi:hypothetical protein